MTQLRTAVHQALLTQRQVPFVPRRKDRATTPAAVVIILAAFYSTVWITDAIEAYAARDQTPYEMKDQRPPIEKCPRGMPRWDCIKNAEYAK